MSVKFKNSIQVDGSISSTNIANATTDTDKFLVSDSGVVKYRTGAEVISDLGLSALYVPYTGATGNVDLGANTLLAKDLIINHSSGSGVAASITKNGSGEALTVIKGSGSGNAMSVTGGLTSLVNLSLSTVANATGDFLTHSGGVINKRTPAQVLSDIGAAPASGSGNYIQNQIASAQSANMWISGNAIVNGNISTASGFISDNPTLASLSLKISGTETGRLDNFNSALRLINFHASSETTIQGNGDINVNSVGSNVIKLSTSNTERMRITSGGNVGIGTTSPSAAKLVLNSGTSNQNALINGDKIGFTRTSDAAEVVYFKKDTSLGTEGTANINGYDGIQFRTQGPETVKAVITSSGNVGIGTTSPGSPLDVQCNSSAFGINIRQRSGDDFSNLVFSNSTNTALGSVGYVGTSRLRFTTNGLGDANEKLSILANGNVGIGTTSPFSIGTGITTLDIQGSAAGGIAFGPSGIKNYIYGASAMYVAAHTTAVFSTSGSERMRITSTGNVGIGTSSPSRKLNIVSDNAQIRISDGSPNTYWEFHSVFFNTNQDLVIRNQNLDAVTINSGGNVGIGTTNPALSNLVISPLVGTGTVDGLTVIYHPDGGTNRLRAKLWINDFNGQLDLKESGDTQTVKITANGSSYFNGGNVGIGTTSPARPLSIVSNSPQIRISDTASPSANWWEFYSTFSNTNQDLFIGNQNGAAITINASRNVGIGTSTPGAKLDVRGGATDTEGGDIYSSNRSFAWSQYINGSTGFYSLYNGSDRFVITTSGNVGIGTTNPLAKLHVAGSLRNSFSSGSGGDVYMNIIDGVSNGFRTVVTTSNQIDYTFHNGSNQEVLSILNSGNVGIGTSGPSYKLDVTGDIRSTTNIRSNNGTVDNILSWTSEPAGVVGTLTNHPETFWTNSTERMRITTSGNVGIGTTSPAYKLDVAGEGKVTGKFRVGGAVMLAELGTGVLMFGSEGGNQTAIYSANSEVIRINTAGLVGIGTTSPAYKLDVVGSIRVGDSSTSIFTATNALPLQLSRGLDVDVYGANSCSLGIGSIKSGVHKDGVRINGTLEADGVSGNFSIDTLRSDSYTTALTIKSNGNVGIGTTAPIEKLHVVGNSFFKVATNRNLYIASNTDSVGLFSINDALNENTSLVMQGSDFRINTFGANERMRITSAGNVGIGTTSPTVKLQVDNNTHNYFNLNSTVANVQTAISAQNTLSGKRATLSWEDGTRGDFADLYSSTLLTFTTQSSEKMRITSAGNVGIGTTTPNAKLDVAGDALINQLTIGQGPVVGQGNTALGQNALASMAGGKSNIAVGFNSNSDNDVTGLTTIGVNLNTDTNLDPLGQNCLAISQFNSSAYSNQVPHIYAPSAISVGSSSTEDIITFDVNHYVGAFIEYVITRADGGDYAAGTVTAAWKDSGSGTIKDTRDVVWSSFMDDFEFLLSGTTVQLRNDSAQGARIRITVRAMIRT
jgi:hypothetical protein